MSPQKVEQIYNTTIIGGPNHVASGSDNIISGFEQVAGDLSSLKDALARLGLQDSDIGALQSAIDQDGEEPPPGPAVKSWLGGIKDRVSSGSLVLAGNASGSMNAIPRTPISRFPLSGAAIPIYGRLVYNGVRSGRA